MSVDRGDSSPAKGFRERDAIEPSAGEALRVLIVDDSAADAKLAIAELTQGGRSVHHLRVDNQNAMRAALTADVWDVILCDWNLSKFSAEQAIRLVEDLELDVPLIILAAAVGEEAVVDEAMRTGAQDFVLKGRLARLLPAVVREIRELRRRRVHLQSERRLILSEEALRQREAQLRQAQKMEALGQLAGGVAHDFNNALSVILTYCELLLSSYDETDPARNDIDEIRLAGGRAADLTRQLLMFSRQDVAEPRVLDLNRVLDQTNKMLSRLLREDIELVVAKGENVWKTRIDPTAMDQVIVNLVVNARDAMPEGGRLKLETSNVTLDQDFVQRHLGALAGDYVALKAIDTGTGIEPATMARIFEPFFTTKERGKGTGLGLSTVYGIVQQARGTITVESTVGVGSTFAVYLPRVDQEPDQLVAPKVSARPGSETILLVEDEQQVRTMLEAVLRRNGYNVIVAQDGHAALKAAERHDGPIHLLLTDVVMPGLRGPEVARQLGPLRPEMKVLFISGYTDDSVILAGAAQGSIEFLRKPITPSALTARIRALFGEE
jgi:two-component system cell cycle sensor histidine kinase/response regulator CckA